jgi:hypothetical protein
MAVSSVKQPGSVDQDSKVVASGGSDPEPGGRYVDRLDKKLVNLLTVVGFALPAAGYLWTVSRYGVNVVVGDQFDDLTVIGKWYSHPFDWSALWVQHNENRIFFPNLIVLVSAHTDHFNIHTEEYVSALFLFVAIALVIVAHKLRSGVTPWLYYCPVAFLLLSLAQWQNTLWGFQMAWYLVLLSLAATLLLLDRFTLMWPTFIAGIAVAVVGSYSSLQGLLIWPAGLVLLYHRRRPARMVIVWVAAAAVTVLVYFHGYKAYASSPLYKIAWQHPLIALKFFLFAVGDVVGLGANGIHQGNGAVTLFGLVIVIIAVITIVTCGLRRDPRGGGPIGIALILFGLLFAAVITEGRIYGGYVSASASRYTTFDLLIPVGIYLAVLGQPATAGKGVSSNTGAVVASEPVGGNEPFDRVFVRRALPCIRWAIAAIIVIQIPLGVVHGLAGARKRHEGTVAAASTLRNISLTSESEVAALYSYESPSLIREQVRVAEIHHLTVFSDSTGSGG